MSRTSVLFFAAALVVAHASCKGGTAGTPDGGTGGGVGGGAGGGGGDAGMEPPCDEGFTDCDGTCRDTDVDRSNCGACGYVCDVGLACVEGACVLLCPEGRAACDGACVALADDDAHCGACGASCGSGECAESTCGPECAPGEGLCDGACVATATAMEACGSCGNACDEEAMCLDGRCCQAEECGQEIGEVFEVIALSDLRGSLNATSPGGTASFVTFVDGVRATSERTLVVASGLFGRASDYERLFPGSTLDVMDWFGLDAAVLTAGDLELGFEAIDAIVDDTGVPLVSSNLPALDPAPATTVFPYVLVHFGTHVVAIIGLADAGSVADIALAALATRAEAAANGATIFVAVTDLDVVRRGGTSARLTGRLLELAKSVYGYNLILGRKTFLASVEPTTIHGALVVPAYDRGREVVRAQLHVGDNGVNIAATVIDVDLAEVPSDPAIEADLSLLTDALATAKEAVVGSTQAAFPYVAATVRTTETPLGNLLADAVHEAYPVDAVLLNAGLLLGGLPAGDVTAGDVYALTYPDAVATLEVTGAQLWAALENAVSRLPDANGRFPLLAGMAITFDPGAAAGSRIRSVVLDDGRVVRPDDNRYTIATIEGLTDGIDQFTMLVRPERRTRDAIANVLFDYLAAHPGLAHPALGRVTPVD